MRRDIRVLFFVSVHASGYCVLLGWWQGQCCHSSNACVVYISFSKVDQLVDSVASYWSIVTEGSYGVEPRATNIKLRGVRRNELRINHLQVTGAQNRISSVCGMLRKSVRTTHILWYFLRVKFSSFSLLVGIDMHVFLIRVAHNLRMWWFLISMP